MQVRQDRACQNVRNCRSSNGHQSTFSAGLVQKNKLLCSSPRRADVEGGQGICKSQCFCLPSALRPIEKSRSLKSSFQTIRSHCQCSGMISISNWNITTVEFDNYQIHYAPSAQQVSRSQSVLQSPCCTTFRYILPCGFDFVGREVFAYATGGRKFEHARQANLTSLQLILRFHRKYFPF